MPHMEIQLSNELAFVSFVRDARNKCMNIKRIIHQVLGRKRPITSLKDLVILDLESENRIKYREAKFSLFSNLFVGYTSEVCTGLWRLEQELIINVSVEHYNLCTKRNKKS